MEKILELTCCYESNGNKCNRIAQFYDSYYDCCGTVYDFYCDIHGKS